VTLLTYNSKYVVTSSTAVTTSSTALVDDTQASQTFTLSASQIVLVIYSAYNNYGSTIGQAGAGFAISIDGVDHVQCQQSLVNTNYASRGCPFWIGTLAAGSHTIKGRFCSGTGATTTIDSRVLLIYILNGNEFQFTESTTSVTNASSTFANDTAASVTFTPSGSCVALCLYNASNCPAATESIYGKKIAVNIAGTDYAQTEQAPGYANGCDSVFTCQGISLSARIGDAFDCWTQDHHTAKHRPRGRDDHGI
jgi:hypothetical protein